MNQQEYFHCKLNLLREKGADRAEYDILEKWLDAQKIESSNLVCMTMASQPESDTEADDVAASAERLAAYRELVAQTERTFDLYAKSAEYSANLIAETQAIIDAANNAMDAIDYPELEIPDFGPTEDQIRARNLRDELDRDDLIASQLRHAEKLAAKHFVPSDKFSLPVLDVVVSLSTYDYGNRNGIEVLVKLPFTAGSSGHPESLRRRAEGLEAMSEWMRKDFELLYPDTDLPLFFRVEIVTT